MKKEQYLYIEQYMLSCMQDSAHDREHVYRVLYIALELAEQEQEVDREILITACLLHDIGRTEQFENPALCHAEVGGKKAYAFLRKHGWDESRAHWVENCILSHRYRSGYVPDSLEAKLLFDADKLDVTGAIGIARTLLYQGKVGDPLYSLNDTGEISEGTLDRVPSFCKEYCWKLEKIYDEFYTEAARRMARQRQQTAREFYEGVIREAKEDYRGKKLLQKSVK